MGYWYQPERLKSCTNEELLNLLVSAGGQHRYNQDSNNPHQAESQSDVENVMAELRTRMK